MPTTQDGSARRWRPSPKTISITIALLITAVLLYISVRGIEWSQVWRTVSGAKLPYLGLGLALGSGTLFLRALRWRILLTAEGPIGVKAVFSATAAGYFGNNFLPARAGELVRTFMVSSRSGLNNAFVLATAISERIADAVALVTISSIVLLTLPDPPGWLAHAAKPVAMLGLAAILVIIVLPRLESILQRILDRVPAPVAVRIKLKEILEQALRGMRTFHNLKRLLRFGGLTIVIWCADGFGMVLAGWALGLPISLPIAFLLIGGMGLGSAMPSAPGYIGVYQFVGVTVLTPFGIDRADAVAFILVAEVLQYLVVGCWGALGIIQYRRIAPRISHAS